MAAMWRSCGNDRQKDAIARSCPLSRVFALAAVGADRCALRYGSAICDQRAAAVIARGKLGERGRAYRPSDLSPVIRPRLRPGVRRSLRRGAAGHDRRACEQGLRPTGQINRCYRVHLHGGWCSTLPTTRWLRQMQKRRWAAGSNHPCSEVASCRDGAAARLRAGAANRRYARVAMQIPQARGGPVISSPCAGRQSKIRPCHLAFIVGGYYSKYWRRCYNSLYYRPEQLHGDGG
jgi:hypothetical protein